MVKTVENIGPLPVVGQKEAIPVVRVQGEKGLKKATIGLAPAHERT